MRDNRVKMLFWSLMVVSPLYVLSVQAGEHPTVPDTVANVAVVGSDAVMKSMESGSATFLDARKSSDFEGGTIPGSFNCQVSSGDPKLDDAEVEATVAKLKECEGLKGADQAKPIVTFCNGLTCWRSPKAALALHKMGFKHVEWYREGMNDWNAKGLPKQ